MALLEVRDLAVSYGGVAALRGVDLDVDDRRVVAVLGANGAGKSSMANAVCGVVRPRGGTIVFDGRDITGWPVYKVARMGLVQVPEGRRVIGPLSTEDNLRLGALRPQAHSHERASLEFVYALFPKLFDRRRVPGGLLSGGEQQMLALGRAIMAKPAMIVMDEPSMGLAPLIIEDVMAAIHEIARSGVAVLMAEQNAGAALALADYGYVLELGTVVHQGNSDELRGDPRVVEAFLGSGTATA